MKQKSQDSFFTEMVNQVDVENSALFGNGQGRIKPIHSFEIKKHSSINPSYKTKNDGLKNGLIKQTILSFPYVQYFEGHPNADQIATEYLKYTIAIRQDKFTPNVLEAIQNDLKGVFDNRTYNQDKQKDYDLLKIGLKILSKYQRMID